MASNIKDGVVDVIHSLDVAGIEMIGKLGGLDGYGFKLLGILFGLMFFYRVFFSC